MKNGLSIASVSELRHEVEDDPREAPFRYNVRANWSKSRSFSARIAPAVIGSIRVPRAFELQLTDIFTQGAKPVANEWHPVEVALFGIGGCVMATYMMGCTTKGIAISDFSVELTAKNGHAGPLSDLSYHVNIASDGKDEQLSELASLVTKFSPNHRTIIENNSAAVVSGSVQKSIDSADCGRSVSGADRLELRTMLDWRYAFQIVAHSHIFNEGSIPFWVDQPKQAAGIDMGLNPQECLLVGWAGSVLQNFVALSRERGISVSAASVDATGTVDVRGVLGVDESVPVKVQGFQVRLESCVADEKRETLNELFVESVKSSPVTGLIVNSCSIGVTLVSNNNLVCAFTSER